MYILILGKLKKQSSLWKLGTKPVQVQIFGKTEAVTESFDFERYVKRITEHQAVIALDGFIAEGWEIAWEGYKKRYC